METRIVDVDINDVIGLNLEGFLDLLDELFFAQDDEEHRGILSDISYKVIGCHDDGTLKIAVTADPERDGCEDESCARCYAV